MRSGPQVFPTVFILALFVVVSMMISGCAGTTVEDWSRVPQRKAPRSERLQYGHEVQFAPGEARLDAAERRRLDAFLARADVGYRDAVHVEAALPGEVRGATEDRRLAERREATVAAHLALKKVRTQPLLGDFGLKAPAPDAVQVVVRRYVVTLPGCPDWTDRPGWTFENTVYGNWGCATATNLGLMVADPGDLVAGRPMAPVDGEYAVMAIERYHKGETKPLEPEDVSVIEAQQKTGGSK